jgi:uncharacterized protein with GYD domain
MPTYITLFKFTDQGIKNIKNVPSRVEENVKSAEAMGCKVICVYAVMGEYDFVAISEAPNDEAHMALALTIGARGDARSTTLKAFSKEEFGGIVQKLS